MKKQLVLLSGLILSSSVAFADNSNLSATINSGFYIGAAAGLGKLDIGNGYSDFYTYSSNFSQSKSEGGFIGRLSAGYMFNKYFGLETGYGFYASNTYSNHGCYNIPSQQQDIEYKNFDAKFKTWTWDLLAKGTYPITDSFSVYAKLGLAYVKTSTSGSYNDFFSSNPIPYDSRSYNYGQSAIRPAYSLGVAYSFNENFALDLSWYGVYGKSKTSFSENAGAKTINNTNSVIPTINTIMLGINYKF